MKVYLKTQFRLSMFKLEHENPSDFYLSCWQKNRTSLPFFCVRLLLFLTCVGILVSSLVIMGGSFSNLGLWFIYMTHWGVLLITITTAFATVVSCQVYFKGPIGEDWQLDPVLDFFLHGMNSIIMFILLMTSRHPIRLMHFYFVLCIGIIYLAFSGIYYAAGGLDPLGNHYIYPTLDWKLPGQTAIMAVVAAVSLIVVYLLVVALGAIRDALTGNFAMRSETMHVSTEPY
ncbi:protein rolling stone-like isoform X2 [Hyposmocoma kahamanoa]|uniref:protein rolling stone-like isoform X2 n=1 Tax=Hyposmocoma kahamanoa TaxID=1477025 RepID=UPI000E6D723B|nr:protein rolling stone-like isoform X2 [Hyposmocoma kahamanoa]